MKITLLQNKFKAFNPQLHSFVNFRGKKKADQKLQSRHPLERTVQAAEGVLSAGEISEP